jgi:hypothetical protein
LQKLPQLKQLTLERIDIADSDVEQLRRDLPGVKIEVKPLTVDQRVALEKMLKP